MNESPVPYWEKVLYAFDKLMKTMIDNPYVEDIPQYPYGQCIGAAIMFAPIMRVIEPEAKVQVAIGKYEQDNDCFNKHAWVRVDLSSGTRYIVDPTAGQFKSMHKWIGTNKSFAIMTGKPAENWYEQRVLLGDHAEDVLRRETSISRVEAHAGWNAITVASGREVLALDLPDDE